MKRKEKIRLVAYVIIPIIAILIIALTFYKLNLICLIINKLSYIFTILCVGIILFKIRNIKIGYDIFGNHGEIIPQNSIIKIIAKTLFLQLSFISLYLIQNIVLKHINSSAISQITDASYSAILASGIGMNAILFPWPIITFITVYFSYMSAKKNPFTPFGDSFTFFQTHFINNETRHVLNLVIMFSTKLFLISSIIFASYYFVFLLQFNMVANINPAIGIIISFSLLILTHSKYGRTYIKNKDKENIPQGRQLIVLFAIITIITLIGIHIIESATNIKQISSNIPIEMALKFWNWSWWIISIPLISSMLAKIFTGRSFLLFSIINLTCAFIISVTGFAAILFGITNKSAIIMLLIFLVGIFPLIRVCFYSDSNPIFRLGFFPLNIHRNTSKHTTKKRNNENLAPYTSIQLWFISIGLTSTIAMFNINLLILIVSFASITNFTIYLLNGFEIIRNLLKFRSHFKNP